MNINDLFMNPFHTNVITQEAQTMSGDGTVLTPAVTITPVPGAVAASPFSPSAILADAEGVVTTLIPRLSSIRDEAAKILTDNAGNVELAEVHVALLGAFIGFHKLALVGAAK